MRPLGRLFAGILAAGLLDPPGPRLGPSCKQCGTAMLPLKRTDGPTDYFCPKHLEIIDAEDLKP